jgi:acyl-coenzyme A synthetase/AMP-(fatty) acid ligase
VTTLDSIFSHARARPDAVAAVKGARAISYRELAARITLARRFLRSQAVGRERIAALCVHDILEGWIIRLALRGLGVTSVSVRSAEEIGDLGPVSVVSTPNDARGWPGLAATNQPLIWVPSEAYLGWEMAEIESALGAGVTAPGRHILLTSGTTGLYKKVLYDDGAEARLIAENVGPAAITPDTVFDVFDVFDFGGWTGANYTWPTLAWTMGGRILIDQSPNPWRSLAYPGLTHAVVTPHLLASLMARPADAAFHNNGLRLFVVGGVLSQSLWRAALDRLTRDIYSVYGSTESCLIAYTRIETVKDLNSHKIPAAGTLQVVDAQDRPLPAGQAGVVRIRTAGVDRYLDDPDPSQTFFRGGYFYPGDLGVVSADGRLTLQGRVTDVINVLGNKIASLPIETALLDLLGAEGVCVFSVPGETGEEVHVAIQLKGAISAGDLKTALLAALPPGIPEVRVHSVMAFPRNAMGKIERTALKDQLSGSATMAPVAP